MRSMNSGVSGMRSFQTKMDVIGNNIANVETAGFKSASVTFTELINQKVGGSGQGGNSAPQSGNQVGLGVRVASITRNFEQGAFQTTNRSTDMAIEGQGFFMVKESNLNYLTRAGNFSFNKNGNLVDNAGRFVQGFNADRLGNVTPGTATENVRINFDAVFPPQATSNIRIAGNLNGNTSTARILASQGAYTTAGGAIARSDTDLNALNQVTSPLQNGDVISFELTLNDGSNQSVGFTYTDGATLQDLIDGINAGMGAEEGRFSLVDGMLTLRSGQLGQSSLALNMVSVTGAGQVQFPGMQTVSEGVTGTQTISATVYDSLGKTHTLIIELTQLAPGTWNYEARFVDGEEITSAGTGTLEFDENGVIVGEGNIELSFNPGTGGPAQNLSISFGDNGDGIQTTQFYNSSSMRVQSQDGYAQGELVDVYVNGDGNVIGVFDNGSNRNLAQLAVGNVANINGLETVGNGMFRATGASGDMVVSTAANLNNSTIYAGVLEGSNVDLAKEFTDMITAQRAYQSNARVIRTADEMLNELVNLKR